MSAATGDEHEDFPRWLTSELRAKVGELAQRPDGDFCTDLAEWLITAGHVQLPSDKIARERELANLRMQRDRAWHQLTVMERAQRNTMPAATAQPAGGSSTVEV
jgi:hypothetical protein